LRSLRREPRAVESVLCSADLQRTVGLEDAPDRFEHRAFVMRKVTLPVNS
jgi:hypothetical protein